MDIIHLDMFKFEFYIKGAIVELKRTNEEERQVTKPTSPLQSCRLRTEFSHPRSRSIAVAPDTMCRAFF
jgi:hypothetical protein